MTTPTTTEADERKAEALAHLSHAREAMHDATMALCSLEGHGYSDAWSRAGKLYDQIGEFSDDLRSLEPPTGVFKP